MLQIGPTIIQILATTVMILLLVLLSAPADENLTQPAKTPALLLYHPANNILLIQLQFNQPQENLIYPTYLLAKASV